MHIKFYIGIGLLAALGIGCFFVGQGIRSIQAPTSQQVETAIHQADNELQKAVSALENARKIWASHRNTLASFSNHGPMDDIDALFAQTISYGANGLKEEFQAGCEQLTLLLQSIFDDHRLTWWNLLTAGIFPAPFS